MGQGRTGQGEVTATLHPITVDKNHDPFYFILIKFIEVKGSVFNGITIGVSVFCLV